MTLLCSVPRSRRRKGRIRSAGPTTVVIVNKDVDEELVYQFTKVLCENMKTIAQFQAPLADFDLSKAANVPIPIHPGAERYYKEVGVLK